MSNLIRPTQPKRKLTKLDVNFVSLVPQGANPSANIVMIKEFKMNTNETGISVNIDEKTLSGILQKGMVEFFSNNENPAEALTSENIQKALSGVTSQISEVLSKSVSEAVAKAMEEKKPEEKKPADKKKMEEETDKGCKTKKSADETFTIGEVTISKEAVGEETFNAVMAIQKELAKERYATHIRALEVEVEKSYPNLAGSAHDKAILLSHIESMPEPVAKLAKEYLDKANENMGKVINKEFGSGEPNPDTSMSKEAEDKLDKLAKSIMERDGINYYEAYTKALNSSEGAKLYDQHLSK